LEVVVWPVCVTGQDRIGCLRPAGPDAAIAEGAGLNVTASRRLVI
jgi:hypothetical protein